MKETVFFFPLCSSASRYLCRSLALSLSSPFLSFSELGTDCCKINLYIFYNLQSKETEEKKANAASP